MPFPVPQEEAIAVSSNQSLEAGGQGTTAHVSLLCPLVLRRRARPWSNHTVLVVFTVLVIFTGCGSLSNFVLRFQPQLCLWVFPLLWCVI